ncbi:hypothetical protein M0R45_025164 [Rubus argutus]|uniref:Uncharacterized protein n=1 Tax=Rubus argutus TaxID=59490 RepID=A0AAW1WX89_RUBAR
MTKASQKQPSVVDDFNSKRKGGAVIEEDIADEDIADDDFADKLVARTRIDIDDIPEEEFLEMIYEHDHNKCIESQKKASNLFHASENKVEDIPLDLDWEEFDGSEMLEALESMNESEFMEALESLDESDGMDIFEPTIVTRPSTWIPKSPNKWIPKCPNKWIPICPDTLSPKCPNTLSLKCPNTLSPKCV